MRPVLTNGLLIVTALFLSSCGKDDGAGAKLAKGQVIATVNGEDITIYELGAELQGFNPPPGADRKKIEQAALQRIVDRKILADIARERKLDKTPQYLFQTRRADEMLLANLLQQDVAGKIPSPSGEDVEKYIATNPWMFGERKLLIIDQIQFPMPADRRRLMEYQPLKTLDQVEQKLIHDNVDYRRVPTSLDTLQLPASMVKSVMALPPGEVFVVPSSGGLTANQITAVRATPLIGPDAQKIGKEMVQKQRMAERTAAELEPLIKGAREKISYQEGYAPTDKIRSAGPATASAPAQ